MPHRVWVFTTLHERAFDLDLGFQQMFPLIPCGVGDRMKEGRIKPEFEFALYVAAQRPAVIEVAPSQCETEAPAPEVR